MAGPRPLLRITVALATIAGCKPASTGRTPGEAPLPDDIAEIEARLARNADVLQDEGIVVAQRTEVPATGGVAPSPVEEPAEDEAGDAEGETATDVPPEAEPEPMAPPPRPSADEPPAERRPSRVRGLERRRDKRDAADRCQRICDLAEATCDLSDRICALASRHPDEVRYDAACERAEAQCDAAANACSSCVR